MVLSSEQLFTGCVTVAACLQFKLPLHLNGMPFLKSACICVCDGENDRERKRWREGWESTDTSQL